MRFRRFAELHEGTVQQTVELCKTSILKMSILLNTWVAFRANVKQ
jgi:hypothetical protein